MAIDGMTAKAAMPADWTDIHGPPPAGRAAWVGSGLLNIVKKLRGQHHESLLVQRSESDLPR